MHRQQYHNFSRRTSWKRILRKNGTLFHWQKPVAMRHVNVCDIGSSQSERIPFEVRAVEESWQGWLLCLEFFSQLVTDTLAAAGAERTRNRECGKLKKMTKNMTSWRWREQIEDATSFKSLTAISLNSHKTVNSTITCHMMSRSNF